VLPNVDVIDKLSGFRLLKGKRLIQEGFIGLGQTGAVIAAIPNGILRGVYAHGGHPRSYGESPENQTKPDREQMEVAIFSGYLGEIVAKSRFFLVGANMLSLG